MSEPDVAKVLEAQTEIEQLIRDANHHLQLARRFVWLADRGEVEQLLVVVWSRLKFGV